ncbi:SURF1 family protein [Rhodopseudomonas boonkerdii]|uniref:SURF1 family protein n=1 Tax=Rhodopseudomonas boonkerdii TaxID=475937 RepID=UPI001E3A74BD|nr:SURF1 family protein [Rhodopseudomonas boonkerdii]
MSDTDRAPRGTVTLSVLAILAILGIAGLTALGIWQVERRAWKLDLIERVDQRSHAAPAAAPGPAAWLAISRTTDEYRRVTASGTFVPGKDVMVQAVSDLGAGFWVLTPLRTDTGFTVLVNRGFVSPDERKAGAFAPPASSVTVTGLLRISEPKGGFLRNNDPAAGRWFSRDVAAIAESQNLAVVAPYFIDADKSLDAPGQPHGGLTVVSFPNNHAVYALTWFGLALMLAAGAVHVGRHEWKIRKKSPSRV